MRRGNVAALLCVVAGGVLGASARAGIDLLFPAEDQPFATLLINLSGSLLLGLLVGGVWPRAPHWLRAGLGTGLIGTFTTYSAIAVSVVQLTAAGEAWTALGYLAANLAGGFGAASVGLWAGARLLPAPDGSPPLGEDE